MPSGTTLFACPFIVEGACKPRAPHACELFIFMSWGISRTRNGLQILESWSSESWLADFLLWNPFCFPLFQSKIWRKTCTIRNYYFKLYTKCKLCIWLLDSPLWWPEIQNVETWGHSHIRTILLRCQHHVSRERVAQSQEVYQRWLILSQREVSVGRQALFSSRACPFVFLAAFPSLSPGCSGRAGLLLVKAPNVSMNFNKPNPVKCCSHQAALSNCT